MVKPIAWLSSLILISSTTAAISSTLGLPPVSIPKDNPQTDAKIKLGERLFHDIRFSADGQVSCATCHDKAKGFTDNLKVSKGFNNLTGTRNAPTVINSAFYTSLFWDGREPDLESQSKQPFVNPVEGGLHDHTPIIDVIQNDPDYPQAFQRVFNIGGEDITIEHVAKAIASFERTLVSGDSPFDRYNYAGDKSALTKAQVRGLAVFRNKGRCVSCHIIEQTQALFTDNRFHNIGIGFKSIQGREAQTAAEMIKKKRRGADVDVTVLTQANMSELGRFAVSENFTDIGAFKTPTLRNIAITQPYMHDGSLQTLEDVVDFYNNGGRVAVLDTLSDFLSGGIRPLDLNEQEKKDLVAFLKALTSPEHAPQTHQARKTP
ncbi:MAG: cytochrome-c peroxidase [Candidatus Thiodiazotropha sp. (ex Epidulcina cf. delphinae)]|nr:cytochrome-c peroxidase [Candidatus Thiodiazotropha sp. (ex Epidulcina cf. delphinae)]MCU7928899.1 cytochrome-c peroxidase [Candidatus Thiodiazotropha sp. (ex Dulcina madagascariensis)]